MEKDYEKIFIYTRKEAIEKLEQICRWSESQDKKILKEIIELLKKEEKNE